MKIALIALLLSGCVSHEGFKFERENTFTVFCLISQCEVELENGNNNEQSEGGESVDVTPL